MGYDYTGGCALRRRVVSSRFVKAMRKLHHITRLDYVYGTRKTHGWWVRFQRKDEKTGKRKVFGQVFIDATYGGKAKALTAAIEWRDANEARYPVVRNGSGSGRRHAPIGHSIFWEYKSARQHDLNGCMKVAEGERPAQFRCSIREHGRKVAAANVRSWYRALRRLLREEGVLASEAALEDYWERLKNGRSKGRRLPWAA